MQTVALTTAPGQALRADAAPAWDALAKAVHARYGWTPSLTDSLRPYAVQERIFRERYQRAYIQYAPGKVDRRVWQGVPWYRRPGTAAAAVPGTSNHGNGTAVDVTGLGAFGSTRYNQLATVAGAYGWNNNAGRTISEPWHWEYAGGYIPTKTTIKKGFLMALNDQQQQQMYDALVGPNGSPQLKALMPFGVNLPTSVAASREALQTLLNRSEAVQRNVSGTVKPVSLRQEIADIKTVVLRLEKVVTDLSKGTS